ncbi:MAG: alpha/beta fold hydrolase [Fimbriimonadales bacterium]|nr:alpha/beta fold hydrolase [Fimbriimonadales bacterium]
MGFAIVVAVGFALGVLLVANYLATRATLRPPRTPFFMTPRDVGLPYQNVAFPSRDGVRLFGWWMPNPKPVGVAILCHGYLMNRCEPLPVAKELWHAGFHCLVFDFRAMGKSEGDLCTIGDMERLDVQAAVDFAERVAPALPVVVYGASMGGAACLLAAAEDPRIRAVVADSAYARLDDAVKDWWRNAVGKASFLLHPTLWIGRLYTRRSPVKVAPEEVIAHIAPRPVLLMHGTRDQLIPPRHAERLYQAAREPKQLWWADGCEHVQARYERPDEFYTLLVNFMLKAVNAEETGK